MIALRANAEELDDKAELFQSILRDMDEHRCVLITEAYASVRIAGIGGLHPEYGCGDIPGLELTAVAINMDWLIYCSHENSITLGGSIIEPFKALVPNWESFLWSWDEQFPGSPKQDEQSPEV